MDKDGKAGQLGFRFLQDNNLFPVIRCYNVNPEPTIFRLLRDFHLGEWFDQLELVADLHDVGSDTLMETVRRMLYEDNIIGLRALIRAQDSGERYEGQGQDDDVG